MSSLKAPKFRIWRNEEDDECVSSRGLRGSCCAEAEKVAAKGGGVDATSETVSLLTSSARDEKNGSLTLLCSGPCSNVFHVEGRVI